jgi:hypothetical protein
VLTPTNTRVGLSFTQQLHANRPLPPPLTLSRAWELLGPRATRLSLGEFRREHAKDLYISLMSCMWAVILTSIAQPLLELPFVPRGEVHRPLRVAHAKEEQSRHGRRQQALETQERPV